MIEENFIETKRAITDLNCVTNLSWKPMGENLYNVELHFEREVDFVTEVMTKEKLHSLKLKFKRKASKPKMENRPKCSASFTTSRLYYDRKVNEIIKIKDGFVLVNNRIADLSAIEFITWMQDDFSDNKIVKLHTKNKFIKLYLKDEEKIDEIIKIWKMYR
tara:strand:+ start:680 stop:1162 length:483 start_codon:yes stop_codon:yes gene_type:complete